jgi:L-ascorbate metabolism protein UlaG (beta-lactamase superfamily)
MNARRAVAFAFFLLPFSLIVAADTGRAPMPETDTIKTSVGELKITFIGHGTLMFQIGETVIHVDPWTNLADYSAMPKADLVLVTHEHRDHLDPAAIAAVRKEGTEVIVTEKCAAQVPGSTVMRNGDVRTVKGLKIEAVPAYNIAHKRPSGEPFHPRGDGNGYVITFGDTRVYVAGDTENIPEMKDLKDVTIAFLPVNLPYTMTPEMAADAARTLRPKILYPYHFGDTDLSALVKLLASEKSIEVRVRSMK